MRANLKAEVDEDWGYVPLDCSLGPKPRPRLIDKLVYFVRRTHGHVLEVTVLVLL
jgi:hypothetical protein